MRNLILIGVLVVSAIAAVGCSGSDSGGGGGAMPDNAAVRTQNPAGSQRPTLGASGATAGAPDSKTAPE